MKRWGKLSSNEIGSIASCHAQKGLALGSACKRTPAGKKRRALMNNAGMGAPEASKGAPTYTYRHSKACVCLRVSVLVGQLQFQHRVADEYYDSRLAK